MVGGGGVVACGDDFRFLLANLPVRWGELTESPADRSADCSFPGARLEWVVPTLALDFKDKAPCLLGLEMTRSPDSSIAPRSTTLLAKVSDFVEDGLWRGLDLFGATVVSFFFIEFL